MRFTDVTIRALPLPLKGQKTHWDDALRGFGCRVSIAGTRSFVVQHGRNRQLTTIGRYPVVTLSQARQRAKEIMAERVLGKSRAPTHMPFGDAVEQFLAASDVRASTLKEYKRILNKHFMPRLRLEPIERITTFDLTRIVDKMSDTPAEAHHAFAIVKALFNWTVSRRVIQFSPLSGVRPPKSNPSRERVLTDDELRIVYSKALACTSTMGWVVRLLVLTGQRRGEIGGLRRSYIDLEAKTITWPGEMVKNGRTHTLPYGPMTAAIIAEVPGDDDVFFLARGSDDKPYCGWSKPGLNFIQSCGIAPWTLHDLRRTFASGMQRLGVRMEVTEKLLNHVSGSFHGIVAVYQRHSYLSEMREAQERWEKHVAALLRGE